MANPGTLRKGMVLPHRSTPSVAFNRCNHSPWALASEAFQADPRTVEILGVRQEDPAFFDGLAVIASAEERGVVFHDYVAEKFWNHDRIEASAGTGRVALTMAAPSCPRLSRDVQERLRLSTMARAA